ncbi:hypothetical protein K505DRAFT_336954 [Melanomma pulvis-pyrius CBS 109.77]|uniref:Uncharacterized protein n=1 Tax=Melanomma pulvis-pyrius CBS 109.77 TaxID=1314802 RepID=A0A6A6XDP4_9PLEO|nr:hypothetical protein K505DRAFT_336954 [Melanomma pulvis-pyrius CBS 109.77]
MARGQAGRQAGRKRKARQGKAMSAYCVRAEWNVTVHPLGRRAGPAGRRRYRHHFPSQDADNDDDGDDDDDESSGTRRKERARCQPGPKWLSSDDAPPDCVLCAATENHPRWISPRARRAAIGRWAPSPAPKAGPRWLLSAATRLEADPSRGARPEAVRKRNGAPSGPRSMLPDPSATTAVVRSFTSNCPRTHCATDFLRCTSAVGEGAKERRGGRMEMKSWMD